MIESFLLLSIYRLRKYGSLALLALFVACGSVSNPDAVVNELRSNSGISTDQVDKIAQALRYYPNDTQLSIALVSDSTVAFYGAVRENDSLKTISNSAVAFEIGSLSKVFTSTILADLACHAKLRLEQPIQDYLNLSLNTNKEITFKQLSNHTSGMPRIPDGFVWESLLHMDNPYKDYDENKLRDYLNNDLELQSEPGTKFQYSNIGAGVLGYVLTKIENKSYEELLQENIFQPYGMSNSTANREKITGRLATGLSKRGNPTSYWDLEALQGAGAILSTAEDLSKFIIANFDESDATLKLQREPTFRINESREMALGWFILNQESGEQWYWHNGGTGGFRTSLVINAELEKGVAVMSNISAGHSYAAKIDSLSFILLESLKPMKSEIIVN